MSDPLTKDATTTAPAVAGSVLPDVEHATAASPASLAPAGAPHSEVSTSSEVTTSSEVATSSEGATTSEVGTSPVESVVSSSATTQKAVRHIKLGNISFNLHLAAFASGKLSAATNAVLEGLKHFNGLGNEVLRKILHLTHKSFAHNLLMLQNLGCVRTHEEHTYLIPADPDFKPEAVEPFDFAACAEANRRQEEEQHRVNLPLGALFNHSMGRDMCLLLMILEVAKCSRMEDLLEIYPEKTLERLLQRLIAVGRVLLKDGLVYLVPHDPLFDPEVEFRRQCQHYDPSYANGLICAPFAPEDSSAFVRQRLAEIEAKKEARRQAQAKKAAGKADTAPEAEAEVIPEPAAEDSTGDVSCPVTGTDTGVESDTATSVETSTDSGVETSTGTTGESSGSAPEKSVVTASEPTPAPAPVSTSVTADKPAPESAHSQSKVVPEDKTATAATASTASEQVAATPESSTNAVPPVVQSSPDDTSTSTVGTPANPTTPAAPSTPVAVFMDPDRAESAMGLKASSTELLRRFMPMQEEATPLIGAPLVSGFTLSKSQLPMEATLQGLHALPAAGSAVGDISSLMALLQMANVGGVGSDLHFSDEQITECASDIIRSSYYEACINGGMPHALALQTAEFMMQKLSGGAATAPDAGAGTDAGAKAEPDKGEQAVSQEQSAPSSTPEAPKPELEPPQPPQVVTTKRHSAPKKIKVRPHHPGRGHILGHQSHGPSKRHNKKSKR